MTFSWAQIVVQEPASLWYALSRIVLQLAHTTRMVGQNDLTQHIWQAQMMLQQFNSQLQGQCTQAESTQHTQHQLERLPNPATELILNPPPERPPNPAPAMPTILHL